MKKSIIWLVAVTLCAVSIGVGGDVYVGYRVETGVRHFKDGEYTQARSELALPAAIGHSFAQSMLATLFIQGLGGHRDIEVGREWLKRSSRAPFAHGSFAEGLFFNGEELMSGVHGVKDSELGKQLMDEAIRAGYKGK